MILFTYAAVPPADIQPMATLISRPASVFHVRIGVVGVQGDVSEHVEAVEAALRKSGRGGNVILLKRVEDITAIDAATIPGGESTTISKLLAKSGLFKALQDRARSGMPVLGTCAGCILLSKEAGEQADRTKTRLLGLMDMAVDRNAFGRQRESFEAALTVEGLDRPFRAVFIRAPSITRVWGECRAIARMGDVIVAARQGNLVGAAFHPELSGDTRFHEWFLSLI